MPNLQDYVPGSSVARAEPWQPRAVSERSIAGCSAGGDAPRLARAAGRGGWLAWPHNLLVTTAGGRDLFIKETKQVPSDIQHKPLHLVRAELVNAD
jgi:hypothetical protein